MLALSFALEVSPILALSFALEVSPVAVSHLGCGQSSLCWLALIATVWLGLCSSQLTVYDVSLLLGSLANDVLRSMFGGSFGYCILVLYFVLTDCVLIILYVYVPRSIH